MDAGSFRRFGHELVDWVADYMEKVEGYPVMSGVRPGEIRSRLPENPPAGGQGMEEIIRDLDEIILPGITHWQHPRFFAYFPATTSGPSILAELVSAGLGINAMLWQTSPAATELEETVMEWLRRMLGLPEGFEGVIQDTASTATLCALLCARERLSNFEVNEAGFPEWHADEAMRVYTSTEAHSSVEKGVRIAGFGSRNLVKVPVDSNYAMDTEKLRKEIESDLAKGYRPCCVCATVGTTSSTAVDPLREIGKISDKYGLWLHVDAALAGSAAILPEKRPMLAGVELVDSFVFNPHKWLFTNFDCSAFFCRHPDILTAVFSIHPEYLKTGRDREVKNFRDWGIQLGRRFRALKLWFVIRYYGVDGLREKLRSHIAMAQEFKSWIEKSDDFELMAPVQLNTVCFRFNPSGRGMKRDELDRVNRGLMEEVNASGIVYITHTNLGANLCLRLSIGQFATELEHVEQAWAAIRGAKAIERTP